MACGQIAGNARADGRRCACRRRRGRRAPSIGRTRRAARCAALGARRRLAHHVRRAIAIGLAGPGDAPLHDRRRAGRGRGAGSAGSARGRGARRSAHDRTGEPVKAIGVDAAGRRVGEGHGCPGERGKDQQRGDRKTESSGVHGFRLSRKGYARTVTHGACRLAVSPNHVFFRRWRHGRAGVCLGAETRIRGRSAVLRTRTWLPAQRCSVTGARTRRDSCIRLMGGACVARG